MKNYITIKKCGVMAGLIMTICICAEAITWDADFAADLNFAAGNPNGNWSYGYATYKDNFSELNPDMWYFTPLTIKRDPWSLDPNYSSYKAWGVSADPNQGYPHIGKVVDANTLVGNFPQGTAILYGDGNGGSWAVARWTAPHAGTITIFADFGRYYATTVGYTDPASDKQFDRTYGVIRNDAEVLFLKNDVAFPYKVMRQLTVAAGDRIHFIAGVGRSMDNDWVSLDAKIKYDYPGVAASLSGDMSFAANPNGNWSYGYCDAPAFPPPYGAVVPAPTTANFTLFDTFVPNYWGSMSGLNVWKSSSFKYMPAVMKNTSGSGYYWNILPRQAVLYGRGRDGKLAVARWTAPISGGATISTAFRPGRFIYDETPASPRQGQDEGVIYNKTNVVSYVTDTWETRWGVYKVNVNAGDTIDIVGGTGLVDSFHGLDHLMADVDIAVGPQFSCTEPGLYDPFMKGDLNGDCNVTFADMAIFCGNWLKCNTAACLGNQ